MRRQRCGSWPRRRRAGPGAPIAGDRADGRRVAPRGRRAPHRPAGALARPLFGRRSIGAAAAGSPDPAVARGASDGCTAAMPRGRRGAATARRRAGRGGWTRRSWPSARRASRPAPSRRRTAPRAGVRPTCAAGRRPAARSATKSAAWARSGARSASPGSRHARRTPGPTPSGKPSAKKRPELIAAAVGAKGRGKRLELWFQML